MLIPEAVTEVLEQAHYPASKLELMALAFAEMAPEEVIHALDELPEEDYPSPEAVRERLLRR